MSKLFEKCPQLILNQIASRIHKRNTNFTEPFYIIFSVLTIYICFFVLLIFSQMLIALKKKEWQKETTDICCRNKLQLSFVFVLFWKNAMVFLYSFDKFGALQNTFCGDLIYWKNSAKTIHSFQKYASK